ncbi:carboxypeptidase regulatory-like domain-containing protein [Blastopirellula sp. J2-11]|uniref:carboxypeptidase regulatory-like domain-containing protein n=1 Tax=Blastopirellula sp. J2-11 TaxID=2943192 RepID=UPI0021C79845|nr:carboxypeptidase regulatory-like domain-containing protein [Blastopirellula sp. J2-11]UUO05176.1 carboxypeptidase regulatory-like domain-containing protein [Blastopirellula sp. J2-11]
MIATRQQILISYARLSGVVALVLAALTVGCSKPPGPETGYVTGVVTLDGKPIDNATVKFEPVNARPSVGFTDADGRYDLIYTASRNGAVLGEHQVRITTANDAGGGEGGQPLVTASKETVPVKYNVKTELTAQVDAGSNTINFDLKTK